MTNPQLEYEFFSTHKLLKKEDQSQAILNAIKKLPVEKKHKINDFLTAIVNAGADAYYAFLDLPLHDFCDVIVKKADSEFEEKTKDPFEKSMLHRTWVDAIEKFRRLFPRDNNSHYVVAFVAKVYPVLTDLASAEIEKLTEAEITKKFEEYPGITLSTKLQYIKKVRKILFFAGKTQIKPKYSRLPQ
jgi:hypothetical protein